MKPGRFLLFILFFLSLPSLPALWDKRDLFNRDVWVKNKDRFLRSYQTICPTVRAVGLRWAAKS